MTETLTMSSLYNKLSQLGLNQDYVRNNGLPSWWNDELNNKSYAVLEGAGYIADNLNLDLKSLLAPEEEIRFNSSPPTKFKQYNNQNKTRPHVAQAIVSRIAELIAYGTKVDFTSLPTDVNEIRTEILTTHPKVNLISLLEYCWNKGIIVAHFDHFPENTRKFAGLIQWQFSRPVIILSSKHKYSARLAFDLAHELGHLALGHLKEGILIDEKIESYCNDDEEENQANLFATQLLLGDCDNCLGDKQFHNHNHLIKHARDKAEENPTVEIDSIILNNAWYNKKWGFAIKALDRLNASTNGQQIINEYLVDRLYWDNFNDENYEYLEKVLGV
ncbi:hypothetical protein NIES4106_61020 (plasmid) [Fischerella sp. NIES-4106]|nr:hypothetical protein NIES4106_61020 [Fischerella sp. NIES-4106]